MHGITCHKAGQGDEGENHHQMTQKRLFRRIAILLAASLAASLPVVGAGAQNVGTPSGGGPGRAIRIKNGKTSPIHSYKDAIRETIYIESTIDDDENGRNDLIATDIIRPRGSGRNFKVSSIYEMSPYYQNCFGDEGVCPVKLGRGNEGEVKEEEDGDFVPEQFPLYYDNFFVPRGYAFIAQDMPGTRNSEGCMVLGGNGELAAAKATMRWLNGKGTAYRLDPLTGEPLLSEEVKATWSNGKAGMIGKSYDGTIANAAAAMGLPGLKTIVPIGGINRWYNYMYHHGVQFIGNSATAALFTYYIDQPPPDDEEAKLKWIEHMFTEGSVCEAKSLTIAGPTGAANPTGDYNAFWDERDYLKDPKDLPPNVLYPSNARRVRASVFIANGINDYNVKPDNGFEWFKWLKKNNVPVKMWQSQTGHVDPFDYRREKWVKTLHRWFDRWLYGINNGIMAEPRFDVERGADKWVTSKTWPAPKTRRLKLFLGPASKNKVGTLTRRRPAKGKEQSYEDTYSGWNYMTSNPGQKKDGRLLFLTDKLSRDVRMSGYFPIKVTARVSAPDTNFTYLLVDYGRANRVDDDSSDEGIRTLAKESCHGQSTRRDDACFFKTEKVTVVSDYEVVTSGWLDAKHRPRKPLSTPRPYKPLRESEPLTPGRRYAFKWKAYGEDYVFEKGHQIGVVVSGSDSTYTIADPNRASVTVDLRNSRVALPVVGKKGRRAVTRAAR